MHNPLSEGRWDTPRIGRRGQRVDYLRRSQSKGLLAEPLLSAGLYSGILPPPAATLA